MKLRLELFQSREILAPALQDVTDEAVDPHVDEVRDEEPAHQEFHRDVVDLLFPDVALGRAGQVFAQFEQSAVDFAVRALLDGLAEVLVHHDVKLFFQVQDNNVPLHIGRLLSHTCLPGHPAPVIPGHGLTCSDAAFLHFLRDTESAVSVFVDFPIVLHDVQNLLPARFVERIVPAHDLPCGDLGGQLVAFLDRSKVDRV